MARLRPFTGGGLHGEPKRPLRQQGNAGRGRLSHVTHSVASRGGEVALTIGGGVGHTRHLLPCPFGLTAFLFASGGFASHILR